MWKPVQILVYNLCVTVRKELCGISNCFEPLQSHLKYQMYLPSSWSFSSAFLHRCTPIKDDTCVSDCFFNSFATWAATFHLQGFYLVYAIFLCDNTTGCEAYSFFTTDGCGIFIVCRNVGVSYTQWGVRHKQICTRIDSGGQKNSASPCPAKGSNPGSSDFKSNALPLSYVPRQIHF